MSPVISDPFPAGKLKLSASDLFTTRGPALFPRALFGTSSLTPGAKLLYTLLCDYYWHNPGEPLSHGKLARGIGVSVRSARNYTVELCTAGLLTITPRPGRPSLYTISARL